MPIIVSISYTDPLLIRTKMKDLASVLSSRCNSEHWKPDCFHIWDAIYSQAINPLIIREEVIAWPSFSSHPVV